AQLTGVKDPITISSTVGMRKRIEIVKKAKEMKLRVLNIKDLDKFLAETEASLKQRKETKKSKLTRKEKAKAERLKKAEKVEEKKEEVPEEKEKREKEEKRKLLEQKK
ncbi:MAG: eL32 family ribosomal protein, partial [Nanoarchaeota archaeon]